jgi:glutamate--cysteine ligase
LNARASAYEQRVEALARRGLGTLLADGLVGLEKEALRVSPAGTISAEPHPPAFGSALTHPCITTDFSEALLELITPAFRSRSDALGFLGDLHAFVHGRLHSELLWAASMPCVVAGARSIPLARYGTSNAARMKTAYRRGLGNRYGRLMQVIAGVHYNFSLAEDFWPAFRELEGEGADLAQFRSEGYMALVRNLQRFGWLIPYLFGASPAVCKSFLQGSSVDLEELDANSYYYPFATSLRMGDIGYQNRQTEGTGMKASYDSLDAYIRSLTWAIETPCPHYEGIGVKVGDRYEQLNANVLQIENEYYSTVRPKQLVDWLEKPTLALRRRGVRYVEVRSLDVDVFEPLGVSEEQLLFLGVLMRFCLLWGSPRISPQERRAIDENQVLAAHHGRDPALELDRGGRGVTLRAWALELLDAMAPLAELLDDGAAGPRLAALRSQRAKVLEPDLTPSARMLAAMRANHEGFFHFARRLSEKHRDFFLARGIDPGRQAELERLSEESRVRQAEIEAADDVGFDEFLERYSAQR